MSELHQMKAGILEDGVIDAEEAKALSKILYDDGKIDQEEADFLFELNDAVSGNDNSPAWDALFIQAISDFLLKDDESPGEIDEDEARWLIDKIGADGQVDGLEKKLLKHLAENAKSYPDSLNSLLS